MAASAATTYWTESECQKLIEAVRKFPVVWKTDHVDYGKRGPRFTAWKTIARLMESDRGELEFSSVGPYIKVAECYAHGLPVSSVCFTAVVVVKTFIMTINVILPETGNVVTVTNSLHSRAYTAVT